MIIKFWGQKIIIISICTITTKGITQHIKDTWGCLYHYVKQFVITIDIKGHHATLRPNTILIL